MTEPTTEGQAAGLAELRGRINPKAWAEAVKQEHDGKPIWLYLADRPDTTAVVRALLDAYLAAAPSPNQENNSHDRR